MLASTLFVHATSSLFMAMTGLQAVSASPLLNHIERSMERRAIPEATIELNKEGLKNKCIIDKSTKPGSQVGMGECTDDDGAKWQFKGEIVEWKKGSKYWVGTIKNKARDLCLTIDGGGGFGAKDKAIASSTMTWKVYTAECGGEQDSRQKWMIGMSVAGKQNGNFIRPANGNNANCSWRGLSGYPDYTYWPDLWPIESDKGFLSVVCVSPDNHTSGWKTKIGDVQFG